VVSKRNLHPLEILALQDLPWDVRVKRLAAMAIAKKFGSLPLTLTAGDITKIMEKIQEPWGRKGRLRKELEAEINRQRTIRNQRDYRRIKAYSIAVSAYTPDFAVYNEWSIDKRRDALALKRVGNSYKPLDRRVRWSLNRAPNYCVVATRLSKDKAFVLAMPNRVWVGHCWSHEEQNHKVRYLLFKVNGIGSNVRVPISCKTVDEAIQSLKRTSVLTAEKKSYAVEIDWADKCFRVRSPRRKSWREIPFKEAKRSAQHHR
jgi:hypothetical protein